MSVRGLRLKQCSIEMWLRRKRLNIGWSGNISNNDVLIPVGKGICLLDIVKKTAMNWSYAEAHGAPVLTVLVTSSTSSFY